MYTLSQWLIISLCFDLDTKKELHKTQPKINIHNNKMKQIKISITFLKNKKMVHSKLSADDKILFLSNLNRKLDLILDCKSNEKNKRRKRKKVTDFIYLYVIHTPWDIISIDSMCSFVPLCWLSVRRLSRFLWMDVMILLNWARVSRCWY